MSAQRFALQPFPSAETSPPVTLTGCITRRGHTLALGYVLHGALGEIALPPPAANPARTNGLWKATCFEFFLGIHGLPRYWEFNLSPSGHWNVYRFDDYRQGRREEAAFAELPFSVQRRADVLKLALEVNLHNLVSAYQVSEAAVAAVLKSKHDVVTYWALIHPGHKPDFHRRDSFVLTL